MTYQESFHALADPTRRAVIEMIARKPRPVAELAHELPVSRPAVSQHLKVLSDAGLIAAQQVGTRRIYALRPEGVVEMRAYLDSLWGDVMGSFAASFEEGGSDD